MENLYTDKTKKLNTSFTTYNNENGDIEVKTSKSIPKDKIQIKVRYDSDNVSLYISIKTCTVMMSIYQTIYIWMMTNMMKVM